ncbi:MAG TPA: SRPBCC family protein [Acidimicrobiales bacterium]|nr:SRPBCC family protein [Acidimicrobiales bacterium]
MSSDGPSDGPPGSEPSGRFSFEVTARSAAPVEIVWPLVGEAERWKEWAWMTRTYLVRPGPAEPQGVGALRRFAVGPFGSSEEVVAWDPPGHLAYVARRGLPVRSYRADVHLEACAGGTTVRWSGSLDPLMPGTGPLVLWYVRRLVGGFAKRLCRYADLIIQHSP